MCRIPITCSKTDRGKYIFTAYEKGVDPGDLPFFIALLQHLSDKDIPCPVPVADNNGNILGEVNGRPMSIVSFLAGKWPRAIRNQHCSEVGEMLARMHNATADFELERKNGMAIDKWNEHFNATKDQADSVKEGMRDEVESALAHLNANWPEAGDLPRGVIHADLFPDNVFFQGEKLSGLLDFYFACNDFYAYDFAITLNAWCFEEGGEFNITKARLLLSSYNKVRPFTERELNLLPLLASGAAMRFLLSRLYDGLFNSDGDMVTHKAPIEYLNILRFHRQVKSHTEYGL